MLFSLCRNEIFMSQSNTFKKTKLLCSGCGAILGAKKGQKTNIISFCKWKMHEKQKNLLGKLRKNQERMFFDFWSKINSKHKFNSITAQKICVLQTVQKTWGNFQRKNTTIIDNFFRSQNHEPPTWDELFSRKSIQTQRNCTILHFHENKF